MNKLLCSLAAVGVFLAFAPSSARATSITISEPGELTLTGTGTVSGSTFTLSGTGTISIGELSPNPGTNDTTDASYVVVTSNPGHDLNSVYTGKDDEFFLGTNTASVDSGGVLLEITSGNDTGDYVWIYMQNSPFQQIVLDVFSNTSPYAYKSGEGFATTSFGLTEKNGNIVNTPEPSSLLLLGTGMLALALLLFWKGRNARETTTVDKAA